MKKITWMTTLLIFCFFFTLHAQKKEKYADRLVYLSEAYSQIDSIKNIYKSKEYKSLIYQAELDNPCFSSILVINTIPNPTYWFFTNGDSIRSYTGKLQDDKIFLYKDYLKTGILKKEDVLAFIPPLVSKVVMYNDNKVFLYFEDEEDPSLYDIEVAPEREKYRREWANIIRQQLDPIFEKFCNAE